MLYILQEILFYNSKLQQFERRDQCMSEDELVTLETFHVLTDVVDFFLLQFYYLVLYRMYKIWIIF